MGRILVHIPPVKASAGGVRVLCDLAGALCGSGFDAWLAPREAGFAPPRSLPGLASAPIVTADQARPGPGDVWVVPEGWPAALAPGLEGRATVVVYCQNWAYLLANMPQVLARNPEAVFWLAVSGPTAWHIRHTLGVAAPILRPGIDLTLFAPPAPGKPEQFTVAYMPRKNRALAQQIREICDVRAARAGTAIRWLEIKDMVPAEVAESLGSAHVFLATGFPEGCPLPPLEAMACGCLPVGFSGFGGLDYLRQIFPDGYRHWLALRDTPFGGNAIVTADADVPGAALAVEQAGRLWREGGDALRLALEAGQATARTYGHDVFAREAVEVWSRAPWSR